MEKHLEQENFSGDIWDRSFNFNQASFARDIRIYKVIQTRFLGIISAVLGLLYMILGLSGVITDFYSQSYSLDESNFGFVLLFISFSWPFLALLSFSFSYCFAPRCPYCQHRLYNPSAQLGSGFCPHCRKTLFENLSLYGFRLKRYNPLFCFSFLFSYVVTTFLFILIISYPVALFLDSSLAIAGILIFEGILSIGFPFFANMRWESRKRKHAHGACKICHEYPQLTVYTYTGNCSECGSPSAPDWPPLEIECLEDLPTWDELQAQSLRYIKIAFPLAVATAAVLFAGILVIFLEPLARPYNYILLAVGLGLVPALILAGYTWIYFRARSNKLDKALVFFGCPYCNEYFNANKDVKVRRNSHSDHYKCLKNYERCSFCCRRLIKRIAAPTDKPQPR